MTPLTFGHPATGKTRGQRRREWNVTITHGERRYSSRWGEYIAAVKLRDIPLAPPEAVLVDPGLTRSDRDELEGLLKLRHKSRLHSVTMLTTLCVAFLLTLLLLASPIARLVPDAWRAGLPAATLIFPLVAVLATRLWFQKKGAIPEKFQGRALAGNKHVDDPYRVDRGSVLAAVRDLGELENTVGSTNVQVDDRWRRHWSSLTSVTEESESRRAEKDRQAEEERKDAEREWAEAPVDPQVPT